MSFKFINGIEPKPIEKDFDTAMNNLLENIHKDYVKWNSPYTKTDWTKAEKRIRIEGITKFKKTLYVKPGRKFDKIMHGTSCWGFVAKKNGEHKGIPYFTGDVFKAATWRAPAKHVRGSIFYDGSDWYQWTGPNYL